MAGSREATPRWPGKWEAETPPAPRDAPPRSATVAPAPQREEVKEPPLQRAVVTCPACGTRRPTFVTDYGPAEFYCTRCDAYHEAEATPARS